MNHQITRFVPLALLFFASVAVCDEGHTPLFDGKSLRGWNGDDTWFRVEDGVIIAGNATKKIPHNYFLCTNETFENFELSVEAKLVGQGNNAGVQYRTKRIPNATASKPLTTPNPLPTFHDRA